MTVPGLPPIVVTLGETMVLLHPAEPDQPLARARLLTMDTAGADSNFAIAMSRLGLRSGWISRVGADPLGDFVLAAIGGEEVDVSQVKRDPHPTGVFFKHRDPATRTTQVLYYRRGSAASHLTPDDLDPNYLAGARLVHLNGMTCALSVGCTAAAVRAFELAPPGSIRSLDLNLRLQLWDVARAREALSPLIRKADVLLGTVEEFEAFFESEVAGEAMVAAAAMGPTTVVAKRGPQGAIGLIGGVPVSHPGFVPPRVVDEVGAGDGFDAGFLTALLEGCSPQTALRWANLVGASSVSVPGDIRGYPTRSELEERLATWPENEALTS